MPEATLVRPYDVAMLLGLATQTVINRANRGAIPGAVFIGQTLRFDMETVRAFVKDGGIRPQPVQKRPRQRRLATPSLGAEDSVTTVRTGNIYSHRWLDDEDRSVTGRHPFSPGNKTRTN